MWGVSLILATVEKSRLPKKANKMCLNALVMVCCSFFVLNIGAGMKRKFVKLFASSMPMIYPACIG